MTGTFKIALTSRHNSLHPSAVNESPFDGLRSHIWPVNTMFDGIIINHCHVVYVRHSKGDDVVVVGVVNVHTSDLNLTGIKQELAGLCGGILKAFQTSHLQKNKSTQCWQQDFMWNLEWLKYYRVWRLILSSSYLSHLYSCRWIPINISANFRLLFVIIINQTGDWRFSVCCASCRSVYIAVITAKEMRDYFLSVIQVFMPLVVMEKKV